MALLKKKLRRRQYPSETKTKAGYADDITFSANTPTQAKSLLHSLEQTAGGIDPYMNANKIECMCFKQEGVF